ncbi:uncharacterized protein LOC107274751 [Cephus cinctus]|uniref:Uncharacterized protein LOC107274751 n=1 Tax=Cephus cinctus TaxID=211228 RepID=A0AAJ7FV18_CEPCN|nr:uncharacterized protein LOC107274751 [Cephus cinctus]XP_015609716.1 uncharacterized protein LOC107274751 [Cephus cinctus]XP_024947730.1 uncharacterized protein LOC107274751 [Cephus cinctus]
MTMEMPSLTNELFDAIHSGEICPMLPNKSWGIHCAEIPEKCIVISEVVMQHVSDTGLVPLYIKQIVFDNKLNFEVYFLNSRIVLKNRPFIGQTIAGFEHVVAYINSLKLCAGGPDISQYSNIKLECAYKDPTDKWRHNLCTLEISGAEVCESCLSLGEVFKRHAQRNKPSAKSRKVVKSVKRKRVIF